MSEIGKFEARNHLPKLLQGVVDITLDYRGFADDFDPFAADVSKTKI